MTRFLLIRHATTDANGTRLAGRLAGVHLNEHGLAQVEALAKRVAEFPIAAIYSSPLELTLETAEPIARLLGREVAIREGLLELDFGEWTNRAFAELDGLPGFRRFNAFRSCAPVPGGEFMLQAQARIVTALERLKADHAGECVAVVSHGDMIRAAIAYYAGIPLDLFQRIDISPASVSVVDADDSTVSIRVINHPGDLRGIAHADAATP